MADAFLDLASHHLWPEQPQGLAGGRPRVGHCVVLNILWFVLATSCRWDDVSAQMGCSGRTAHRFLRRWEELGYWDRLHADLLRLLRRAGKLDPDLVIVDAVILRAFGGGEQTGRSPVDRGKKGSKHTLLVDRHGVPLAIRTAGANASAHRQIIPLVVDFPKVTGKPGRPKELPDELYADRGYDSDATRRILSWLGIEPSIGRRKRPRGSGLGKVRWVVERALNWLKGLRRMRLRYDRLAIIQEDGNTLAGRRICFRLLHENRRLGWIGFFSSGRACLDCIGFL
jgi:transposase